MTREELLALIDQAADEGWTELDLSGQNLTELPPKIGKLTQLETLILGKVEKWDWVEDTYSPTLSTNAITTLPAELAALQNLKTLDLIGNPLTVIPDCVFEIQTLESLYLISIGLAEIPAVIGQLKNLTRLSLSNNQISEIPAVIGQLKNLTRLSLSNNQISEIPAVIGQLKNLTELSLYSNQISEIPAVIGQLKNLTKLHLSQNQISEIPAVIGQLKNLTELYLFNNQISEIPAVIGQLKNLTELYLFNNQISEIPVVIGQLKNLPQLYLSGNQISEIPVVIGQLKNLTELSLFNNQISEIPAVIGQLKNLTELSLSNNQISEIPAVIGQLKNLTRLSLSNNQISEIPAVIGQLKNLTELSLFNNQIYEIPTVIGHLKNLTELDLSGNQISEIPVVIGHLKNLTKLDLSGNQISEIPAVIGHLKNLTKLYLHNNQISEIPAVIGHLKNLTKLYLHNNQISEIPAVIGHLKNLTELDLERNQIREIPIGLEALPKLETLDLRGNPLPISPEVLGNSEAAGSVDAIFNYCRKLRSAEVRPLNEAKLLLVGQGSVGKTSLIERLLHDRFDRQQRQTDGLDVRTWGVHVNSKDVRLNVWDFGGQEIYHSTHQFFLTKRSLYLLVCNCRTSEDENRIEYWLKLIASFGDQSPVIIVGNKCDEQPFDINRKALRDKYPNIKAILETSCETNQGLDELRQAILNEVGQLKEVYDLLPLSWFEVKEQLEAMDQDFISYSKYACICDANSISEERDQEQLVDLLHRLGLVLNFREHPILQTTTVLNPDWVTQGIYALLSDESLKTKTKGILTYADLSRVLDPVAYPAARHRYLIELMREEKFQLCFQLPDCRTPTFLIPGLLAKEEPEDISLESDTLEFQYNYRILPESILSRFIVLTHEKIYNAIYWRSGVMLVYRQGDEVYNIARVKSDIEDRKIFISISGRETTRRVFLGILRDVFNKIHGSFGNLEVSEWVPVPGHPDHPPLDYQELLGLEEMGIRDYPIGKLKLKVDIRQLLDGYEPIEARQRRRLGDEERIDYHIHGDYVGGDKVGKDKVGNDKVGGRKTENY